ncbi:MAG: DUF4252 domain-containing protein [Bacteroidota bacterium]
MKLTTILTFFVLTVCFTIEMVAQSSGVDRYFEDYKEDDRFSLITVSGRMFSIFAEFDMNDPAEKHLVDAISKLKGMKMLIGSDVLEARGIYDEIVQKPASSMEELMSVRDSGQEFQFFITEDDGTISELLMIGYQSENVMILSLVGDLDLQQIAALSQKMALNGFEHFNHVGQ